MTRKTKKKRIVMKVNDEMVLKQYVPEDAPAIFELIDGCRKHLNAFDEGIADKYPDLESVRQSITDPPEVKKLRMGIWVNDVFVGSVNLKSLGNSVAELGYFIGEEYLGKHYAALASRKLIRVALKSGKTKTLIAEIAKTNSHSITVAEALGFEGAGSTKTHFIYKLERWIPFNVDAMSFYGVIDSLTKWKRVVKEKYGGNPKRLLALRKRPSSGPGYMTEFRDDPTYPAAAQTLGQWMRENKLV